MKTAEHSEWQGYSLEEMMSRRATMLARIEVEKIRLAEHSEQVRRGTFLLPHLINLAAYADIIVVGLRLWRRLAPLFRRK